MILVGWRLPVPLDPSSIAHQSPLLVAATITPTFAQLRPAHHAVCGPRASRAIVTVSLILVGGGEAELHCSKKGKVTRRRRFGKVSKVSKQ
jgi:hypothetical protein